MKVPNNQEGEREEEAKESLGQKGSDSFLAHFLLAHFHLCPLCWVFLSLQIESQALYIFHCNIDMHIMACYLSLLMDWLAKGIYTLVLVICEGG